MAYDYKQFRRGKLPHIQPPNAAIFVTFRLAGCVPKAMLAKWKAERQWLDHETERVSKEATTGSPEAIKHDERLHAFSRAWFVAFEEILDKAKHGPTWLAEPRVKQMVSDSLHYRDGKVFTLDCYCIMSNRVHVVFKPFLDERTLRERRGYGVLRYESDEPPLDVIMYSLKSFTASEANKLLRRTGAFWGSRELRPFHPKRCGVRSHPPLRPQ